MAVTTAEVHNGCSPWSMTAGKHRSTGGVAGGSPAPVGPRADHGGASAVPVARNPPLTATCQPVTRPARPARPARHELRA